MTADIVLDLSRLISRLLHHTPTGVDRVEMAYARELAAIAPERLSYAAVHPLGGYGRLPTRAAEAFLDTTRRRWDGIDGPATATGRRMAQARALYALRPRAVPRAARPRVLIQSSPHHLHDEALTARIVRREGARWVCLLHDLIPIEFPEYARPNGKALHLQRVRTVARHADAVLANSDATRRAFLPYLAEAGRSIPVEVAHLGLERLCPPPQPTLAARPYFVCLGTIEPRKNHLLLLNLWRAMAERDGPAAVPELLVIGRRGWENEQVVDMLERCPALTGCVKELNGLPDRQLQALMAGARAILLPSFAEGYGMPVTEALGLNIPVLCSDLPALREAGGDVPEYLDPLDGPAWRDAVLDYATGASPRRAAQLSRLAGWRAPTWSDHVATVLAAAEAVAS